MIKAGDTKKVVVLAAIAVVVITVAIVRSIPVGDIAANVIAEVQKGDDATAGPAELPKLVLTNPFFHTKLIAKVDKQPETQTAPPKTDAGSGAPPLQPIEGHLPSVGTQPLIVKPEDVPGSGQQSNTEPKKKSIVLEAVLKARTSVAMVSVDGASAEARSVGDEIADGVRIVSISQEEVVLSTSKGKKRLSVGRRLEL